MSKPSFSDIDRWLFDYVEGNLSSDQIVSLKSFIEKHPDLEFDLESWSASKVESIDVEYPDLNNLYKEEKRTPKAIYWFTGVSMFLIFISTISFIYFDKSDGQKIASNDIANSVVSTDYSFRNNQGNFQSAKSNVYLSNTINIDQNTKINEDFYSRNHIARNNYSSQLYDFKNLFSSNYKSQNSSNKILENNHELNNVLHNSSSLNTEFNDASLMNTLKATAISNKSKKSISKRNNKKSNSKKRKKNKFEIMISKSVKKINRFMEKDLALKNTRDHNIHVPGFNHLDANFSSAGDVSSTRFRTVNRAQWFGEVNQKLINKVSLDMYSRALRSGFAIQADYSHYANGVIQDWNTSFIYSPKIILTRSLLIEPAIRFKMGNKFLNASKVIPGQVEWDRNNTQDFYTSSVPVGNKLWYRDLGASILVHSKWLYFGIQADNLLNHIDNIYSSNIEQPRRAGHHYVAVLGTDYDFPSIKMDVSPYLVHERQENRSESWGGINMTYKSVSFGGAYSSSNNYAASIGLNFNQFAITYQFDRTFSNLLSKNLNSHQISLLINSKLNRSSRRYITL